MSELDADPYTEAAEHDLDVVLPGENELFIDVDDVMDDVHLDEMLGVLRPLVPVEVVKTTVSRHGNKHVYLKLDLTKFAEPLSPMARIALQAALGSDRKRELLSALRIILKLDRPPTVFFETRPAAEPDPEDLIKCAACLAFKSSHPVSDNAHAKEQVSVCDVWVKPESWCIQCGDPLVGFTPGAHVCDNCIPF